MYTIVVNATALESSGSLSILRQFIEAIPIDKNVEYLVFISPNIKLDCDSLNVHLVPIIGVKPLFKRFMWDAFGVRWWLRQNNIKPSASISLQNTNFRTGYNIPNYVYYHQSIPFCTIKWSPFKAREQTLWFYKNIYPFFVQIFLNRRTEIFVQLEFIKEGFTKRFGFERNKIHVVHPKINVVSSTIKAPKLSASRINLFYPATPFFYKNHKILFDALLVVQNDKFTLSLTCEKGQFSYDTPSNVNFLGVISFQSVMAMYKECDAMVFPSYIETYGLPLLEAASVGIPILCADLPYAREVLSGYDGAIFIDHTNPNAWAEAINTLIKGKRYTPYRPLEEKSWDKMFEIINH